MDLSTPFVLATVSAGSALGGAAFKDAITAYVGRSQRSSEAERARWASARDAFVELLTLVTKAQSEADGAVVAGRLRQLPADTVGAILAAEVVAEVHATAEEWAEMSPYVQAVTLRVNGVSPNVDLAIRQSLMQELKEMGAFDPDDLDVLRQRFVAAVRSHLRQEPRQR